MEYIAAILAFLKTIGQTIDLVKEHHDRIAALELKSAQHDTQLQHATLPKEQ